MRCKLWLVCLFALVGMASNASAAYEVFSQGSWTTRSTLDAAITLFNAYDYSVIKIPGGEQRFSTKFEPKNKSSILGDADMVTNLIACPSLDGDDLIKCNGDCVAIWNIELTRETNNRASVTGNGININGHKAVKISHCAIRRQNHAITSKNALGSLTDVSDIVMDRVFMAFIKNQAVLLRGAGITVSNCKCQYVAGTGVELYILRDLPAYPQPMANVFASGFQIVGGEGVSLHGVGDSTTEGTKFSVTNCLFDLTQGSGIVLDNCRQGIISKNTIRGCGTTVTPPSSDFEPLANWSTSFLNANNDSHGIYIPSGNDEIIVDSNIICSFRRVGIYLLNTTSEPNFVSGPNNITLTNNHIYYGSGGEFGIWVDSYDTPDGTINNIVINGNQIHGFGYGIAEEGPIDHMIISNNNTYGNTTNIYEGGQETNYIKANNLE